MHEAIDSINEDKQSDRSSDRVEIESASDFEQMLCERAYTTIKLIDTSATIGAIYPFALTLHLRIDRQNQR